MRIALGTWEMAMARIRAIEHRRTVAVSATNDLSALFLPEETQVAELAESTAGNITSQVPLRDSLTFSDHVGLVPEGLAVILASLFGFLGLRQPFAAQLAPDRPVWVISLHDDKSDGVYTGGPNRSGHWCSTIS